MPGLILFLEEDVSSHDLKFVIEQLDVSTDAGEQHVLCLQMQPSKL